MSSIVNKVKEALHSDSKHEAPEGTQGPHSGRVANAADPRVDSDRDHRANPTTHTGGYSGSDNYTHSTGTGATGTGAGFGNSKTTGYNDPEGTHGPHSSRVANAADPRVDSDRDNRGTHGTHGTTGGAFGSTGTGTGYDTSKATTGYNDPEGTHGPHSSRIANAADPRVDSDRDNRGTHGTHGTTGAGLTGAGAGYGSSRTTGYDDPEGTHGPHSSRIANAADPRVDSDRDNRGTHGGYGNTAGSGAFGSSTGAGAGTYGNSRTTGYDDPEGTHGPHSSRVGNAADPRVDSDRDHRGVHNGPGPAPNTAGPHKSDMVNKIDPRVDSDLDGSKTMGGNKTYQSGSNYNKDPTDAAQVPPSVLRQAVGGPTIEHDAHDHDRAGRHQSASHQETHRGL